MIKGTEETESEKYGAGGGRMGEWGGVLKEMGGWRLGKGTGREGKLRA